jgi:hypothetical protein
MNRRVEAELHAHAQQLMRFCSEHKLGFVIAFHDGTPIVNRVTNMDDDELSYVGRALQSPGPGTTTSTHSVKEPS